MLFWTLVLTLIIWILTSPFGIPWWFFLLALIALVVLIWWVVRQRREEEARRAARVQAVARGRIAEAAARAPTQPVPPSRPQAAPTTPPPQPTPSPAAAPQPAPAPAAPDNLRRIEGIGPKIAGILQAAGIKTFAQLAETSPERLREILQEAGFRAPADPTTWPEQAKLAAAGDWDGLKALQDQLEGGRRS